MSSQPERVSSHSRERKAEREYEHPGSVREGIVRNTRVREGRASIKAGRRECERLEGASVRGKRLDELMSWLICLRTCACVCGRERPAGRERLTQKVSVSERGRAEKGKKMSA